MTPYIKILRPYNLLLLALVQLLLKYVLFPAFPVALYLNDLQFVLLVLSTISIAGAGNIINDIYDVEVDRINRPNKLLIGKKISEKSAMNYYILLNIIGVGIGFYLSNSIGKPGFAAIFIVISALLYLYASYLKGILLLGNLLVSFLVSLSLIIVGLFDLFPMITAYNQPLQSMVFQILLHYAFFAFLLNFLRELVKDVQDINGDRHGGYRTLAIVIGRSRTVFICFILGLLITAIVIFYMYFYLYESKAAVLYILLLVIAPLFYFCIQAYRAERSKDYRLLSLLLKVIMFTGMCSILLFHWNLMI